MSGHCLSGRGLTGDHLVLHMTLRHTDKGSPSGVITLYDLWSYEEGLDATSPSFELTP